MIFTTQLFLFIFFPIVMISYILVENISLVSTSNLLKKIRAKDLIIIAFSLAFYMWTCFDNLFRLIMYILVIYIMAKIIQSFKDKKLYINIKNEINDESKKLYLCIIPVIIACSLIILLLVYFKYSNFIYKLMNYFLKTTFTYKSIIVPLGISFITFSAISYIVDIYRGKASCGSLVDCFLYLTFFPKIVSGPIVLWRDFQTQISNRRTMLNFSTEGINRIMIGFSKKLILADTFGLCLTKIGVTNIDVITAWGSIILYMLQIYYDFSSYSDIAIGLSKLLGFEVKENFNFPYRSTSISEFWRRWHISLGTWFREYVYFPLGGSKINRKRTMINLGIVFALTGIWHGSGYAYILWGMINGFLVIFEHMIQDNKLYIRIPKFIKYLLTMFIVMMFWELFRFENVHDVVNIFKIAFGYVKYDNIYYTWRYFFNSKIIILMIIGLLGSTILGSKKIKKMYIHFSKLNWFFLVQEIVLLILFITSIIFMINSTYSPFIYFQY